MSKRYIKQREPGNDWAVIEIIGSNHRQVASGLDESEADEAVANFEKEETNNARSAG